MNNNWSRTTVNIVLLLERGIKIHESVPGTKSFQMSVHVHIKKSQHWQGRIQKFELGGPTSYEARGLGVAFIGPQWVQGEALEGTQGAKPQEAPEF